MSLAYTRASRFPRGERGDSDASSSAAVAPPTIDLTATETSLLLRCDQPATVSVFVSGNPLPVVTWFVGSRRIQEDSSEFRVSGGGAEEGGRKRVLSISRVSAELEDGIQLEAVNCAGSDRIRINVKTYKFLTGRSPSELTRSATLPPSLLRHRFQSGEKGKIPEENSAREFRDVKTMAKDESQNQFQMSEEDYETWEKEMESRSHMRSIDDIIDNLSDEEDDSDKNPEKDSKTKSCDNIFPPTMNKAQPPPPSPPPPPPPPAPSSESSKEGQSSNAAAVPRLSDATTDPQLLKPVETVPPLGFHTLPPLPDCYAIKMIYKDSTNKANNNNYYCDPQETPIWEMFGVKLSDFCKNILSANGRRCRNDDGFSQINRESSPSCRIQARSVPVERRYLGSRPSNSPVGSQAYPETAKKPSVEKESVRGTVGASQGDDGDRRPKRPREAKTVLPGVEKRPPPPPTSRPPLAPKPSFSEVRVANRVASSPCASRPFSADAVKRSASLPKNSAATEGVPRDFHQPKIVDRVSSFENRAEESNPSFVGRGIISDAQKSTTENSSKTTEVEETHFNSSPDDVSKYRIPRERNSQTVDVTERKSSDEQTTKAHRESVSSKKPPVAKDKPFWRPAAAAVGERVSRSNDAPKILIERQTNNPDLPPSPPPSEKPLIPVRRVRSQSSGKPDEEGSDFTGLTAGSTSSARQLSQGQTPDGCAAPQENGAGRIQLAASAAAATRSEGLLTARKLTLLPPCPPGGHGERREWRSCVVLPASKSVDVLDSSSSSRGHEGTPRIGRRSLSKEWNVTTVTTKEEIVILRRPQQGPVVGPPAVTSSSSSISANPGSNKVAWKLPLGPGRPFAV